MRLRFFPPLILLLVFSGCAPFCGECGYLSFHEDYAIPAFLPAPDAFPEAEKSWVRQETFGINGKISSTFEDPFFTLAFLSSYAARSGLGEPETFALLQNRWQELYDGGKNYSFRLQATLDPRFYSRKTLFLENWKFFLSDDRGKKISALRAGPCRIEQDDDSLRGDFRVSFPRNDAQGKGLFENPRFLRLEAETPLTTLSFTWRFRPLTGPDHGK
ncbi:MAG TPA: hypothetical protein DD435_09845 [Cyanobacteria bacterium UBA8530]|nr:hypothetical protein [Cyanobacteria bacterium UBA8530]